MTGVYEWNPTPHRVDMICPICRGCAEFEFAEIVRINLKADVAYFQASALFEYQQFQDALGHLWHGALYFEGLHGSARKAISELPLGYSPENWDHPRYLRGRRGEGIGSIRCQQCGTRAKHRLSWPDDAYYALAYRGHVLWAYHRESALELQDFVLSTKRDFAQYRWSHFLMKVPTIFKTHKARQAVAKGLRRLLAPKAPRARFHRFRV